MHLPTIHWCSRDIRSFSGRVVVGTTQGAQKIHCSYPKNPISPSIQWLFWEPIYTSLRKTPLRGSCSKWNSNSEKPWGSPPTRMMPVTIRTTWHLILTNLLFWHWNSWVWGRFNLNLKSRGFGEVFPYLNHHLGWILGGLVAIICL